MEIWQTILLAIGGNAVLVAVLGYLAKSLVSGLLAKDIKKFEVELQSKSSAAIVNLKSELHLAAIEHQVRFSKLHEKRAEVIADLYKHLVEAMWETESFVSPMKWIGEPSKKEKYITAMRKIAEFFRFFDQHRIYLPEKVCESLQAFIENLRSPAIEFGVYLEFEHLEEHTAKEKREAWLKAWNLVKNDIPKAKQELESEFRGILGSGQ